LNAKDDAAGTALMCPKCGYLIQVPDADQAPRPAQEPGAGGSKTGKPKPVERRAQYVLGGMHGIFLLGLPFAFAHSQDGSPMCLAMFGLNLTIGTVAGFLFCAGMHTPDYLTDWLCMPFTRLRALVLLLPLSVLGFVVAIHVYSP